MGQFDMSAKARKVEGDDSAGTLQGLEKALESSLADTDPRVRVRVMEWARRLIDLSRRNRLLAYRPFKRTSIEFRSPSPDQLAASLLTDVAWRVYEPMPQDQNGPAVSLDELLISHPPEVREAVTSERNPDEILRS